MPALFFLYVLLIVSRQKEVCAHTKCCRSESLIVCGTQVKIKSDHISNPKVSNTKLQLFLNILYGLGAPKAYKTLN